MARTLDDGRITFGRRAETKVTDPVCGMELDPGRAPGYSEYAGGHYYFCSLACKERFDASPQEFVSATAPRPRPVF